MSTHKQKATEINFEKDLVVTARSQKLSPNLEKDLKIYNPKEREAIMDAIMREEVPGIKYVKNKDNTGYYDYKGKNSQEAYREVAFEKMDKIADNVEKERMVAALAAENSFENSLEVLSKVAEDVVKSKPESDYSQLKNIVVKKEDPNVMKGNAGATQTATIEPLVITQPTERQLKNLRDSIGASRRSASEEIDLAMKQYGLGKEKQEPGKQEIVFTKEKQKKPVVNKKEEKKEE